nr:MAG TPA: BRO family protein [Caudoviricetes sp.]
MTDIQIFKNEQFGEVRTIAKDGEPWFVAKDVCEALDLGNSRQAVSRLDEDEKGVILTDTLGGNQPILLRDTQRVIQQRSHDSYRRKAGRE